MSRFNHAQQKTRLGIEPLEDRLTPADLSIGVPYDGAPTPPLYLLTLAPGPTSVDPAADAPLTLIPAPLPPRTVIAVGSPAGSPALARLVDSRTGAEVLRVEPFAGFRGSISVAAGDVNGDGVADLVVGAGAGGGTHVRAFDGATGAELANSLAYRVLTGPFRSRSVT